MEEMFILKLADLRSERGSPTSLLTAQITQLWHKEPFISHLAIVKSQMIYVPMSILFRQESPSTFCLLPPRHLEQHSAVQAFSCCKSLYQGWHQEHNANLNWLRSWASSDAQWGDLYPLLRVANTSSQSEMKTMSWLVFISRGSRPQQNHCDWVLPVSVCLIT